MYRKRDTGELFNLHGEIREAYPNPTLPAIITDEILDEVGYDIVDTYMEMPTVNEDVEKLVAKGVVEKEGKWVQEYEIVPLTYEEKKAKVPYSVTRRQARQALLLAGLLSQVPIVIENIQDPVTKGLAQIEWEDSLEFLRDRPLVIQVGTALGLDEEGLDALFIQASKL